MLYRLLAELQDIHIDLTARDVVELLWLAEQMQSDLSDEKPDSKYTTDRELSQPGLDQEDVQKDNQYKPLPSEPSTNSSKASLKDYTHQEQYADLYDRDGGNSSTGSQIGATTLPSPAATALPDKLQLARALRPLARKAASPTNSVIDEEATVQYIAETGVHIPVLRPEPIRWLDIALVIDWSSSMLIWRKTSYELRCLLEQHGAFRNVYLWELHTDTEGNPELYARSGSNSNLRRPGKPQELVDPARQRLILVVSDCVSRAWHIGTVGSLLNLWGQHNSVTLVQPLPRRLWLRTALATASEIRIQAPAPNTSNVRLRFRAARPRPGRKLSASGHIPIPIVTLERTEIAAWAKMIAGSGADLVSGVLWPTIPTLAQKNRYQEQTNQIQNSNASEQLRRFRANASPTAQELAEYFAAAPLSLPVMRIVQQSMLPQSRLSHLAEVLLGGLIERDIPLAAQDNLDELFFRFQDGVQELLLNDLPRPEAIRVLQEVSEFVSDRIGQPNRFLAYIRNPSSEEKLTFIPEMQPFAEVAVKILKRLGKRYENVAADWSTRRQLYDKTPEVKTFNINSFDSTGYNEWRSTIETLVNTDLESARIALVKSLQHPDNRVRWNAVGKLASIATPDNWKDLQQAYEMETGAGLRSYIYETLFENPINRQFILNEHVRLFVKNIEPMKNYQDKAEEVIDTLTQRLSKDETIKGLLDRVELIGSFSRGTAIRDRGSDVDVIVICRGEERRASPRSIYQLLERALLQIYRNKIFRKSLMDEIPRPNRNFVSRGSSFILDLPDIWLEIMPAIYSSNKSTILAPSDDLQYWEPMYYEEHSRITDQLDTITQGMYRDLVKAVKWWQYHHSPQSKPLSGFALECLVATYFDKNNHFLLPAFDNFLKNIISKHRHRGQLNQVLELGSKSNYKQTNLSDRGHKKFIQTVEYTLSLINQAKVATSLAQELGLWQQVFGTPFPRILSRLQLVPDPGIESADTHDDLLYLDKGFARAASVKPPEDLKIAASIDPQQQVVDAAQRLQGQKVMMQMQQSIEGQGFIIRSKPGGALNVAGFIPLDLTHGRTPQVGNDINCVVRGVVEVDGTWYVKFELPPKKSSKKGKK